MLKIDLILNNFEQNATDEQRKQGLNLADFSCLLIFYAQCGLILFSQTS